ncbi:Pectinesterase [Bertholletia excelsa]
MAKLGLFLLLLSSLHLLSVLAEPATAHDSSSASDFIKASCRVTRYPALCIHCLSSYAGKIQQSEKELAQAALSVTLVRAQSAANYVSKMPKVSGMKTWEAKLKSIKELGRTGQAYGEEFIWHMSNVQTWVSAALTDENTCLDGFSGSNMMGM